MSFVTTPLDMRASVPSTSLSPGARFSLRDFTGANYSRGRPWSVQLLWMLVSRCVTMRWWCPNRLRLLILRSFGARIGTGTLIRHDVKIHWPWKLEIGHHTWIGESTWSSTSSRWSSDRIPASLKTFCCAPAATTDSAPHSSSTTRRLSSGIRCGSQRGRRYCAASTSPTARQSAPLRWLPVMSRNKSRSCPRVRIRRRRREDQNR